MNREWMSGEETVFTIPPEMAGERLDSALASLSSLSRSAVQRLSEEGNVYRLLPGGGAAAVGKKERVKAGEDYSILLPEPVCAEAAPEEIPLSIVYEDADILVLDKPQGMVVHPAPGHESGTLVNALLFYLGDALSSIGGVKRPGIVHRIDRDTSGLLCIAKNDAAHRALAVQLADHSMHREYRALVIGGLPDGEGTIDAPIGRHPVDRKKMAVIRDASRHARQAVTHYTVLSRIGGMTDARVILETGRTHQIRVHMSYIGHPVLGDPVYGGENHPFVKKHSALFHGQMLHAAALVLHHPRTGEAMRFTCPLPEGYREAVRILTESEK